MENLNIKFLDGYCLKFDSDYWIVKYVKVKCGIGIELIIIWLL